MNRQAEESAVAGNDLVADLRPHDLRHTAVALAIEAGWHPKKIQEMLGHSSIEVTLGTYGHLFSTLHSEGADQLDALYRAAAAAEQGEVTPISALQARRHRRRRVQRRRAPDLHSRPGRDRSSLGHSLRKEPDHSDGQKHGLLQLSVDEQSDRLATFGRDGSVRIWDLTMRPLGETMALDLAPDQIGTRAIDAAGGVAAVMAFTESKAEAVVFDPSTGDIIRRFPDHAGQVLALSPDGRTIVYQHLVGQGPDPSNLDVGSIVVRDTSTGATRTEFEGLCGWSYLDVDPSKDCPVPPPGHPYGEWVYGMSVTPDGRRAVAGGQSFAASVWNLNTGSVIATLGPFGQPGSGEVTSAAIHPDGSKVAVRIIADKPRVVIVGLDGSFGCGTHATEACSRPSPWARTMGRPWHSPTIATWLSAR